MTHQELVDHLVGIGWSVDHLTGKDGNTYLVIHDYEITSGRLKGTKADIGILKTAGAPYTAPAAIHTKPHLVPMDMQSSLRTQASGIGAEWQYWSRLLRGIPTPKAFVVQIATIFSEVH
ncbi:hypothetical protein [Sulfoacidibacillus ferrooxidans]|uniref:Uncharacterized protein n=1 Tax=Sulfoacidibacillus ferrooxidans TaxID=2005001 RepID=A0A9X1VCH5_9BACL|nr:hypothetical protein [Sulfoacidibacillus ferrooxidans]MCI0184819.1 hypothetical protein [Sulfoacidibacillus ferrooxidans]